MDDDPRHLAPHDLHVRVGDQHYFVRAARRGSLTGAGGGGAGGGGGGGLEDIVGALIGLVLLVLLALLFGPAVQRWHQRQPWKVAVARATGDEYGPTGRMRTVHRETVVSTDAPRARLAELADDVRAGRFAGGGERRFWSRRRA